MEQVKLLLCSVRGVGGGNGLVGGVGIGGVVGSFGIVMLLLGGMGGVFV